MPNKWTVCVDAQTYRIDSFEKTEEGYLVCYGTAAKSGVMSYYTADGKELRDYVPPDTLRNSVKSLINKPLTLEHPPGLIDSKTAKKYRIGVVLDAWYDEGGAQQCVKLLVDDAVAVSKIETREITQLSPGYRVTRQRVEGGEYNRVQTARENNHLALTKHARGGTETAIHLDSADNVRFSELLMEDENVEEVSTQAPEGDAFPGAPMAPPAAPKPAVPAPAAPAAPAPDPVMALLQQILAAVTQKPAAPAAPAPAPKPAPAMDSTDFFKEVKEYNRAVEAAKRYKVEVATDANTDAIKRAVVAQCNANVELDSKDQAYIDAAFDFYHGNMPVQNSINNLAFDANAPRKRSATDEIEYVDPTQLERDRNRKTAAKGAQ